MNIATAREFLFWCTILNFGVLAFWGLLTLTARGWLHRRVGRFALLSEVQFNAANYAGILFYKIIILAFNLVPYFALLIVEGRSGG